MAHVLLLVWVLLPDSVGLPDCQGDSTLLTVGLARHWEVHILNSTDIVLLNQPDVFLLEFAGKRRIFLGIASGVIVLILASWRSIERVVIDDHVVGSVLETADSLLGLIWFRRLGCFSQVLLQLLASRSHDLTVWLNHLVRVVAIVTAIKDLILSLHLSIVGKLRRIVHAYLPATFA